MIGNAKLSSSSSATLSPHNEIEFEIYGQFQATSFHAKPSVSSAFASSYKQANTNHEDQEIVHLSFVAYESEVQNIQHAIQFQSQICNALEQRYDEDAKVKNRLSADKNDALPSRCPCTDNKYDSRMKSANKKPCPYYCVVIFNQSNRKDDRIKVIAMYQLISDASEDIKVGQYHYFMLLQRQNKEIIIHGPTRQIVPKHTWNFHLRPLISFSSSETQVLSIKSSFEYSLYTQCLQAISTRMFVYEKNRSGIIITIRKEDSSANSYSILSSRTIDKKNDDRRHGGASFNHVPSKRSKKMKSEKNGRDNITNTKKTKEMMSNDIPDEDCNHDHGMGDIGKFYFVAPAEKGVLTNYMFLLLAQVKRGRLNSKDRDNARRRNSGLVEGYLGLRCRHCGGLDRGNYFPSTCKNLQACPSMIYKHLLNCEYCPPTLKHMLKISKTKHKSQVLERENGAQVGFYNTLWRRIHDETFDGGDDETRQQVFLSLHQLLCNSSFHNSIINSPSNNDSVVKITESSGKSQETIGVSDELNNNTDCRKTKFEQEENERDKQIIKIDFPEWSPPLSSTDSPIKISPPVQRFFSVIESPNIGGKRIESLQEYPTSSLISMNPSTQSMVSDVPNISLDPMMSEMKTMFESQSLNVTIDMLDAVAGEILNSNPYTSCTSTSTSRGCGVLKQRAFVQHEPKVVIHHTEPSKISHNEEVVWDEDSINAIRAMVESDEDYRGMINVLSEMNTYDISI